MAREDDAANKADKKVREEELERLWTEYSKERSVLLRNQIVEGYMYVASIIAGKFAGRGVDYDDLYQVAALALVKAVERFDANKGVKFVTYASPTMIGEVKNYFRDRSRLIRLPRRSAERRKLLSGAQADLEQSLMRSPTVEELSDFTGISVGDILEFMEMQGAASPASLDASFEEEDSSLHTFLGYQDASYEQFEVDDMIAGSLSRLGDVERTIIRGRYFDGLSQRQIADRLGVSQMTVSRMERRALETMRSAIGE